MALPYCAQLDASAQYALNDYYGLYEDLELWAMSFGCLFMLTKISINYK